MRVKFEIEMPGSCIDCPCTTGDLYCNLLNIIHEVDVDWQKTFYKCPNDSSITRPDCPLEEVE